MNWRLNYKGKALVISSGLVYFSNKKPKGLLLNDILVMIKENPDSSYYYKKTEGKVTLFKAIEFNDIDILGKDREYYSVINLSTLDPERDFDNLPTTGKELLENKYNSRPLIIK